MSDLPSGLRIGPYLVLSKLGQGAMGVVYRARDPELGRDVALKLIQAEGLDAKKLARFEREGEITARLRHPGILQVHAAGVHQGAPFLAYELIEGARTLDEAFREAPLEQRVAWLRDAARALGHAHRAGILHRDLKPENLLVDLDDQVKVADFGLALAEGQTKLTRTGTTVGSPLYMSPEQIRGERDKLSPASDVWSLAVSLYEALTGQPPFHGSNFTELARAICTARPAPPQALSPDVPAGLAAVCLEALQANPAARPQDGERFAQRLDAALAGRVEPAAESSRGLAGLTAIALVSVALAVGALAAARARSAAPVPTPSAPVASATHGEAPVASDAALAASAVMTRADLALAAARGDPDAQLALARLHACGLDGPRDEARALELWRAAARGEQPAALRALGRACELGIGLEPDLEQAVELYRRAAEGGDRDAMLALARLFQLGAGVPRDDAAARRWQERAVAGGDLEHQLAFARSLLTGPVREPARAARLLERAVRQDAVRASLAFATAALHPDANLSRPRAREHLLRAWEAGVADAAELLSRLSEDPAEAQEWLTRGARAGSAPTGNALAEALLKGTYGCERNPAEARRLLEGLADGGDAHARYRLACLLAQEPGSDPARALELWRCAANDGDVDAACELSAAWKRGLLGLQPDAARSAQWLLRAARGGCLRAMPDLAGRYRLGAGVPQDPERALRWLRRAAEGGYPWACYELGRAELAAGNGEQAVRWQRRGLELGEGWSAYELGDMFLNGNGVAQDDVEAVRWLRVAMENGVPYGIHSVLERLERGGPQVRDPEAARALFAWAQGAHAGSWNWRWSLARCAIEGLGTQPSLDLALELYRGLTRDESPESAPAAQEAARCLILAERYEEARTWLEAVADRNPRAAASLGLLLERTPDGAPEDPAAGLAWYERAAAANSVRGSWLAAERLAQGRGAPADPERARALLEAAAQVAADRLEAAEDKSLPALRWAEVQLVQGRYAEVVEVLEPIETSYQHTPARLRTLCAALTWRGVDAARARLDTLLALTPGEGVALGLSARLRALTGDLAGAAADCDAASRRRWFPSRVHAVRAWVALEQGDLRAAREHAARAQHQANDCDGEAWAVVSRVHALTGERDLARQAAERALAVEPFDPLVWTLAAEALARAGAPDAARGWFLRGVETLPADHPLAARCQAGLGRLAPR